MGVFMSSDYLYQSAMAFKNLLHVKYRLFLGRKGKSLELCITFNSADFFHLSALHKLNNYQLKRLPKGRIFNSILNKEISDTIFNNYTSVDEILQRIKVLTQLETLLDDNNTAFFNYDAKKVNFSNISADYIAKSLLDGSQMVFSFFIKEDERNTSDHSSYRLSSIFPFSKYDYSERQTKYTVLLKEKITANDKILLYRHKNFND